MAYVYSVAKNVLTLNYVFCKTLLFHIYVVDWKINTGKTNNYSLHLQTKFFLEFYISFKFTIHGLQPIYTHLLILCQLVGKKLPIFTCYVQYRFDELVPFGSNYFLQMCYTLFFCRSL